MKNTILNIVKNWENSLLSDSAFSDVDISSVLDTLIDDIQIVEKDASFIFQKVGETDDRTALTSALLKQWIIGGHAPSLAAICAFGLSHFGVEERLFHGVLMSALLGEMPNDLPFHGNIHYKKVLFQTLRLIAAHNDIYAGTDKVLSAHDCSLLMIAACIHDLGHDGLGNTVKGVFIQSRLEDLSFETAVPYLRRAHVPDTDLQSLYMMILGTDVTPIGDLTSPSNQLKAAYKYHFMGEQQQIDSLNLSEDLSRLEHDKHLTLLSMLLHEADLATSAGLTYEITQYETSLYHKELGRDNARPSDITGFLNNVCRKQFLTDAGQRLYAGNLARIYALAEIDVGGGDEPYPDIEYAHFLLSFDLDTLHEGSDRLN